MLFPDEISSPGSFLHTRLSREQTSALLARCRAEQATLLGALMAIALQTLADDQQWRQATQELMVLVNLRGFYAPPLPEWVLGSYVSRMKFWYTAPESLPLWDLARRCRQDVQDDLTPGLHASQDRILRWIRVSKQMLAGGGWSTSCRRVRRRVGQRRLWHGKGPRVVDVRALWDGANGVIPHGGLLLR